MQRYFRVSPPAVRQMVLNLEEHGLTTRIPGLPRSVLVLIPREELAALD